MMFNYYGRKTQLVKYYPKPKYQAIVEPFAGSAQYSLAYWDHDVSLYDTYGRVYTIWHYLINYADKRSILKLPNMYKGSSLDNYRQMHLGERYLIGWYINPSSASGGITSTKFSGFGTAWNRAKIKIANNVYKIKHWKIYKDTYESCAYMDRRTWFVDPPYQHNGGIHYVKGSDKLDYDNIRRFCKALKGQVIICEGKDADWLPFDRLCGSKFKNEMVCYLNG